MSPAEIQVIGGGVCAGFGRIDTVPFSKQEAEWPIALYKGAWSQ